MLEEQVREWTRQWFEEGGEEGRGPGVGQGRAEERALRCRPTVRKFDADTAERLDAPFPGNVVHRKR